jgi:hypothetical protein
MTKKLIMVLLFILLLSSCSIFNQTPVQIEIVSPTKTIIHPLHKEAMIAIEGKISQMIVEVKNNRARVISSGCPDKICIKTGWISHGHEFILCAPNQVSIRIRFLPGQSKEMITY